MRPDQNLPAPARTALVIGGTGMLAGVSARINELGFGRTIVPSRRSPAPRGCEWIDVDWRDPQGLDSKLESLISNPVDLLVVWIHYPYREPIFAVLDRYISESTSVVEVWSHAGARPDEQERLKRRGHSHAVLGRAGPRGEGWLDHYQISAGVFDVIEQALAEESPVVRMVGVLDPKDEVQVRDGLGLGVDRG